MALSTTEFDSAAVLDTPEAIEEYLTAAFESDDPAVISHAFGVVARARGMSLLSGETGLTRQALYKALSAGGNPEFSTVMKVAHALGFRLEPRRREGFAEPDPPGFTPAKPTDRKGNKG